jgi:spermidine synthase
MAGLYLGIFLIALDVLMVELTLIRVFDILWYPNMAYLIITLAMFSFGLAGVYSAIRPLREDVEISNRIAVLSALLGVFTLLLFPILHYFPFDFKDIGTNTSGALGNFLVIYLFITLPFFLGGLILSSIFSRYAVSIQRLYFWDLVGAALGCVVLIPLLPKVGAAGLLFVACGLGLIASAFFATSKIWKGLAIIIGLAVIVYPLTLDHYIEFKPHIDKRGLRTLKAGGLEETTVWDPISKIDIISYRKLYKWIAYDGGTQTSYFYKFDGNYEQLLEDINVNPERHFWGKIVLPSHYLKQNTGQNVLVIGSAGGQETKAALAYGAAHVDAIELVGAVVDLGKGQYSDYIGGIMNDPRVNAQKGEGRSFLRSTDTKYDIIQIMSNHSSSSIAAGSGSLNTTYLQTAEAYIEYFSHLKNDGILHVNHHVYPKMVATAAMAWKEMGLTDFRQHVAVFEVPDAQDNLPTMLIKMSPWTKAELDKVVAFMADISPLVVHPLKPRWSYLSNDFFTGELPEPLIQNANYRLEPSTDDKPYFNFIRKGFSKIDVQNETFTNESIANLLNSRLQGGVPRDTIHLYVTAGASLFFAGIFLFLPLLFSKAGKAKWNNKPAFLSYFGCLGAGFILFELVFVQIFMKLIGYPLYTYSTVLFVFLFGAGLGSLMSEHLGMYNKKRWGMAFAGVIASALLVVVVHPWYFNIFLQTSVVVRICAASALILPLAFFLGMPFPLGILSVRNQVPGTIAWAWAMNGLFTVIGGFLSVVLSVSIGFRATVLVAIGFYVLAAVFFKRIYSEHDLTENDNASGDEVLDERFHVRVDSDRNF